MANITIDTWKMTAIGLVLVVAAVGITTFVVGQKNESVVGQKSEREAPKATKATSKSIAIEHHRTTQAEINQCNEYADSQISGKTTEVLKDAGIGGVAGGRARAAGGGVAQGGGGGRGGGGRRGG